jgi:hypothetical protein
MATLEPQSYLQRRIDGQLDWLSLASGANKRQFFAWRLLQIVLGTSITILSPFAAKHPWAPLALAIAGGGVACSGAVLALNRNEENWVRYRSLAEGLEREKYLFLTGSPPYGGAEEAFPRFVTSAENLMLEERGSWARLLTGPSTPRGTAAAASTPEVPGSPVWSTDPSAHQRP